MMRAFFRALLALPPLLVLAGCCGNTACNCRDRLANSLFISIGRSNGPVAGRFTRRELATVYLTRFDTATRRTLDSLPLPRATRRPTSFPVALFPADVVPDTAGLLVISDTSPFSATTANANLSRYGYRLYVPRYTSTLLDGTSPGSLSPSYYRYTFDRIGLRGAYQADGCCTCYSNNFKAVRVVEGNASLADGRPLSRGQATIVTGDVSQSTAERRPVIIYLSK